MITIENLIKICYIAQPYFFARIMEAFNDILSKMKSLTTLCFIHVL